jgi:Zn-dependent protease
LNLFPLPPLDGSRVVSSLLPRKLANIYESIEPYGFFILLALLLTGILPALLAPSIEFMQNLFMITFSL